MNDYSVLKMGYKMLEKLIRAYQIRLVIIQRKIAHTQAITISQMNKKKQLDFFLFC